MADSWSSCWQPEVQNHSQLRCVDYVWMLNYSGLGLKRPGRNGRRQTNPPDLLPPPAPADRCVQVKTLEQKSNKSYKAILAVGGRTVDAALASQLSELVQVGQVKTGTTIKVCVYQAS